MEFEQQHADWVTWLLIASPFIFLAIIAFADSLVIKGNWCCR